MKIDNIKALSKAIHYHSMISNIIIAFSAVVGIGVTLVWASEGYIWKSTIFWLFIVLSIYFITVMHHVFLKELRKRIIDLDKKEEKKK